jgi:hypothetical protein
MSGIHEKVADWILSLPDADRNYQAHMYCAYRLHADPALAFWYTKTEYEWQKKHTEMLHTYRPK